MKAKAFVAIAVSVWTASCGGERTNTAHVPQEPAPLAASPSYDVHEWGLVRGTEDDRVMLSGPHAQVVPVAPAMPVAKPVLYFHRIGEGLLSVDVQVQIPRGSIVEHWPLDPRAEPASITWRGVSIEESTCPGTRYASVNEAPCANIAADDACETAELAVVETDDGSCLRTSDGLTWNHLFYRGEVEGAPELPLRFEHISFTGRLRVTNVGSAPIPGQLIRLRHGAVPEAALVAAPPAPGQEVILEWPDAALGEAALSLSATLEAAGLTAAEATAFRRAWDVPLFGSNVTTTGTRSGPVPSSHARTSLLYVLPTSVADSLSTLRFEPAPRTLRRVIVAWIDEGPAPIERYPRPN